MPHMASHPTSPSGLAGEAANFRRFNRMYTRFIGTLNEGLLNSDYSLAEARVLYELANRVEPRASDIAEGLGVDPAYLSRMLGKFERAGLLRKKASEQDGRYAELMLTAQGQIGFQEAQRSFCSNRLIRFSRTWPPRLERNSSIACRPSKAFS